MPQVVLQFCAFPTWTDDLIKHFTQGPVGHVDVVTKSGELLGAQFRSGLGGQPSGVYIRPQGYGEMKNRIQVSVEVSELGATRMWNFALAQVGKPYDVEAIFGFIVGRDWQDEGRWVCSEFGLAVMQKTGIFRNPPFVKHDLITPNALLYLVSTYGEVTELPDD